MLRESNTVTTVTLNSEGNHHQPCIWGILLFYLAHLDGLQSSCLDKARRGLQCRLGETKGSSVGSREIMVKTSQTSDLPQEEEYLVGGRGETGEDSMPAVRPDWGGFSSNAGMKQQTTL